MTSQHIAGRCISRSALAAIVGFAFVVHASAAEIPREGASAPDFTLESISGAKVRLADATAQGPVVLVVLRGFPGYQCPVCSAQVTQLRGKLSPAHEPGVRVLLVYPGPSAELKARANEFLAGKALPENFDLLLDPGYAFTNAYGLRWDASGETAYPSTFVLDKARKVVFAKVSRTHGGRAGVDEILAGLGRAR